MTDNTIDKAVIEMQVSKASDLATLLHIEQRVFQYDPDYEGDYDAEVSVLQDKVSISLWADQENAPKGWARPRLTLDEWDQIEEILRKLCDLPGHFDNDLAHQHSMTLLAEGLLSHIVEYREAHELN